MTRYCPFCNSKVDVDVSIDIALSGKKKLLFQAIYEAGVKGIEADELMKRFYAGKSPITLRTAIHGINKRIYPMAIMTKHSGHYRFIMPRR